MGEKRMRHDDSHPRNHLKMSAPHAVKKTCPSLRPKRTSRLRFHDVGDPSLANVST